MATLSVPITPKIERFIDSLVKSGAAENKAHAVRQALEWYAEEKLIQDVLTAEREITEGKVLYGDPRKLLKKF